MLLGSPPKAAISREVAKTVANSHIEIIASQHIEEFVSVVFMKIISGFSRSSVEVFLGLASRFWARGFFRIFKGKICLQKTIMFYTFLKNLSLLVVGHFDASG